MHSFKLFSCYCAMILMATTFNLFADALVDDCEGGTNQNKFGYYWYMYEDHGDGGNSKLSNGTLTIAGTTGNYVVAPTAGAGNTGAGFVFPYTLGPTYCTKGNYNYAGIGTMLCDSNKTSSVDLTGATSITFYIKSAIATTVDFAVLTKEVTDYGYWHALITTTTAWQKATVMLASTGLGALTQPSWAALVPFNIKSIQKLQWQMHTDNVGTNKTGTIYLDDVWIIGPSYTFVPFDLCPTCVGAPGQTPSPAAVLTNMDAVPYNRNARGYYWYCYNDAAGRTPAPAISEISAITAGATIPTDPTIAPVITIGPTAVSGSKGYGTSGYGADIQFTLGPVYHAVVGDNVPIKPFVGVGTSLWNTTLTTDLYNAANDGATGVYFDYMLSGGTTATVVRLEVSDATVFPSGVVHYINLPVTGAGVWKGATVPFTTLVLPKWTGVVTTTPLDKTKLEKLQWAVQDQAGTTGELAIDNVYILGVTHITSLTNGVKFQNNPVKEMSGILTSMVNNNLKVTFAKEMSNASISLVNTRGAIVARNIAASNLTAQLNVAGLARGVYMLNVKSSSKSGADFNETMPVTLY